MKNNDIYIKLPLKGVDASFFVKPQLIKNKTTYFSHSLKWNEKTQMNDVVYPKDNRYGIYCKSNTGILMGLGGGLVIESCEKETWRQIAQMWKTEYNPVLPRKLKKKIFGTKK